MVLLSEIDPYLNQAIERKDNGLTSNYNLDNYHPRYWLVNGRGFPDSIADNGAAWLPNQPYGALAEVRESDDSTGAIDRPPVRRPGPVPERRHRDLPVPPARQQRRGDRS